jgi:hypothetical protein
MALSSNFGGLKLLTMRVTLFTKIGTYQCLPSLSMNPTPCMHKEGLEFFLAHDLASALIDGC